MRLFLMVAAFAMAVPAAAEAQRSGGSGFGSGSGASEARGHGRGDFDRRRDRSDRPDFADGRDRRDRRRGDPVFIGGYGDYVYDPDRAFRPDGYNDWWHDRPDRAYPAWVARNTKCERIWWSGEGWRC